MGNRVPTFFMHTYKGRPAKFDGQQIIVYGCELLRARDLRRSLGAIRKDQRATLAYLRCFCSDTHVKDYSHIRIQFKGSKP